MTNAMVKLVLICVCIIANYQYAASMTREAYELYQQYGMNWPEYQKMHDEIFKEHPLPKPKIIRCRSRYHKRPIKQKKQIAMPYENLKHIENPPIMPYVMRTIKYIENPKNIKPLLHEISTPKSKQPNKDVKYIMLKDDKYPAKHAYIIKEVANLPQEESASTMKISDKYDQNVINNLLNDPQAKVIVVKSEGQKAHTKLELNNSSDNKKAEDSMPVNVVSYKSDPPIKQVLEIKGVPINELKNKPNVYDGIIVGEPTPPSRDDQHMYDAIIVGEHEDEMGPSIFASFG